MKFTRVLSSSVLFGAAFLLVVACAKKETSNSAPVRTASFPSASSLTNPETEVANNNASALDDAESIINAVNGYYEFVAAEGSLEKVDIFYRTVTSDSSIAELIASFPSGFAYFDVSTVDNFTNATAQLFARTTQSERTSGVTVSVPDYSVTINGNTATVDSNKILVTSNGVTNPSTKAPYFEMPTLNLIKDGNGSWIIVAEAPRQTIP